MKTLSDFYISQRWRSFREQLIHERTRADDFVHDELTGEPIRKAYDIIGHHKIELTLQNVNDVEVSLNPDNIMLVSHRSHNELHARFGYAQGKKVYYVYGAPCSTKSTYVNSVKGNSDLIVDIDLIWQAVTGREYYKPDALKANVFDLYRHMTDMVKTRQGRWQRAYVITGGASKGQREREIKELGAEPIYIDTDKETCLQYLHNAHDRDIEQWTKYINEWFENYQA